MNLAIAYWLGACTVTPYCTGDGEKNDTTEKFEQRCCHKRHYAVNMIIYFCYVGYVTTLIIACHYMTLDEAKTCAGDFEPTPSDNCFNVDMET